MEWRGSPDRTSSSVGATMGCSVEALEVGLHRAPRSANMILFEGVEFLSYRSDSNTLYHPRPRRIRYLFHSQHTTPGCLRRQKLAERHEFLSPFSFDRMDAGEHQPRKLSRGEASDFVTVRLPLMAWRQPWVHSEAAGFDAWWCEPRTGRRRCEDGERARLTSETFCMGSHWPARVQPHPRVQRAPGL